MAFLDFSKVQYIKTMDTGEEIRMGAFKTANNMELKYFRVTLYVNGDISGNEELRVNIYSNAITTGLLYQSSWAKLSDISNLGTRWLGWLRLDFNREAINKRLYYYPTVEARNYTRNVNDYYLGFAHDFPYPIFDNGESLYYKHPLQMQIFGYSWE